MSAMGKADNASKEQNGESESYGEVPDRWHSVANLGGFPSWPAFVHVALVVVAVWFAGVFQYNLIVVMGIAVLYLRQVDYIQRKRAFEEAKMSLKMDAVRAKMTDTETVVWLNGILQKAWGIWLERFASEQLIMKVAPWFLDHYKPWALKSLKLKAMNLGSLPPVVETARLHRVGSDTEDVVLEMDVSFAASHDMFVTVVSKLTKPGLSFPCIVSKVALSGKVRVGVAYLSDFPFVRRVSVSFVSSPSMSMKVNLLKSSLSRGFDVASFPLVASLVEEEEKMAAILQERREKKEAKKKALQEEQAAKLRKIEEEMAKEKARIKKEEEAKLKEVDEEKEEGPPLQRNSGQHSGSNGRDLEKRISEWVANLSVGEEEEVSMYIPQDQQEAAMRAWDAEKDPLRRQALEDEKRMEWKLAKMREKKRRVDKAAEAATELEEVKKLEEQVAAQTKLPAQMRVIARSVPRLARIQADQYDFSRSQDIVVRSMRLGFRDFARELVGAVGAEAGHRLDKTERFCAGAIEGIKAAAPKEEEARPPRREPFFAKSEDPATTYDSLSREVVAFEAKSVSLSTFWHKDLDRGKQLKGRTISGQVKTKDSPVLTLDEGSVDEIPYDQIEWGLEGEDSGVGQGRTYAAVAAGGRPQGGQGQGQGGRASGSRFQGDQGVGGRGGNRQAGGRGQGLPQNRPRNTSPYRETPTPHVPMAEVAGRCLDSCPETACVRVSLDTSLTGVADKLKERRPAWAKMKKENNGQLILLDTEIFRSRVGALVDSGATRSYISRKVLQKLRLGLKVQKLTDPIVSILTDNRTMIVEDYVEGVQAYFRLEKDGKVERILHSLTLLVEDSLPFDIVMGMDWGEATGATLHLKEHERMLPSSSGEAKTARLFHVSGVENSLAHCCLSAPTFARLVKREKLEEQVFVAYVKPVTKPTEEKPMDPAIAKLLEEFKDLTEPPTGTVPRPIQHRIEIEPGSRTPKGAVYRMSPRELEELRKQLDELLEKGWIRPSSSPFGAPVLFVPKKEGELRMCIDYRGLNAITVMNVEPLPRIDDLLDRVQGAKYFSKIDFSGYHQIEVHPDDQYKTAFRTRYGHYEFIVMPFGLTNAPATFQRCLNDLFRPWLDKFVVVYLDDILVFSRTLEEHQGHLRQVLEKLREANFKINAKKCDWAKTQVLYLGHVLDGDGVKPEDSKIAAIRDWPTPLLQQDDGNGYRPVEFMSARMPSEKVATSTYERELYALRQALDHWKHYLLGRHFKVYSDHETLRWLKTQAKMTPKLTRWAAEIDQYDFELKPVKGKVSVSFVSSPSMSMKVNLLKSSLSRGFDVASFPLVASLVDSTVEKVLGESLIAPNMLIVDIPEVLAAASNGHIEIAQKEISQVSTSSKSSGDFKVSQETMLAQLSRVKTSANAKPVASLLLEIIEGRNLKAADMTGLSDPFVKVTLGRHKRRTKVIQQTLNPRWEQEFHLPISSWSSPRHPRHLTLEVMDHDGWKQNDKLGDCNIDLADFRDGNRVDFWVKLDNVNRGEIRIAVTIIENGGDNVGGAEGNKDCHAPSLGTEKVAEASSPPKTFATADNKAVAIGTKRERNDSFSALSQSESLKRCSRLTHSSSLKVKHRRTVSLGRPSALGPLAKTEAPTRVYSSSLIPAKGSLGSPQPLSSPINEEGNKEFKASDDFFGTPADPLDLTSPEKTPTPDPTPSANVNTATPRKDDQDHKEACAGPNVIHICPGVRLHTWHFDPKVSLQFVDILQCPFAFFLPLENLVLLGEWLVIQLYTSGEDILQCSKVKLLTNDWKGTAFAVIFSTRYV
ncbi:hypothetical protein CBR_g801 [Chara braunii]|uniref:RNA-directed DNA polymerase n=1 Tax=Chara braunii TaxID=69332 RepID=A0A388KCB4_CHABU|nr:hypothetical protein CBR_g801 [Chara braunii]|eukprot:GBG67671.1 hypothetical protein CBR_g801 [Chara braunii]